VEIDLNKLGELLTMFNQTEITELTLKSGDLELTLRKGDRFVSLPPSNPVLDAIGTPLPLLEELPPSTPEQPTPPPGSKKWVDLVSPMVGTFYSSPAPDEPPFVGIGDAVRRGQTVCIIEAMKLMNEIEAEVNGQIMEILVQNGEPIEYGQPLMRVNPG
jgi:acetyl-CoA carboxylase biotin carboxyl carrier protein